MSRSSVMAPGAAAIGPYSHGVFTGNSFDGLLFLSGQTAIDPVTGKLVDGTIGAQTSQCFRNLGAVLDAAGLSFGDVVKCNVFLTDMNDFAAMNELYSHEFQQPYPARTTIGVASLPLGAKIEIEMIACDPQEPREQTR